MKENNGRLTFCKS